MSTSFTPEETYATEEVLKRLQAALHKETDRDPFAHEVWLENFLDQENRSWRFCPSEGAWASSAFNPRAWSLVAAPHEESVHPKTSKFDFIAGNTYRVAEILQVLWTILDDGAIKDRSGKYGLLDLMKPFAEEHAVFTPFGAGWGRSPFNPNAWRGKDGEYLLHGKRLGKGVSKGRRRHPFEAGHAYPMSEVVAHLLEDIETGAVSDVQEKLGFIDQMKLKEDTAGVFQPTGTGWGLSPYNLYVWRDSEGRALFPNYEERPRRKSFSSRIREAVFAKTGGRCYSCSFKFDSVDEVWIEHIVPFSLGGSDEMENLLPGCRLCNYTRSNFSPYKIQRMLSVGSAMVREMEKSSGLGEQVYTFLKSEDERRRTRRKHDHLGFLVYESEAEHYRKHLESEIETEAGLAESEEIPNLSSDT